jgi:hypothetical protein
LFGIGVPDTKRGEYSRFVAAARVLRVQAVIHQFPDLNNGVFAIG